MANEVEIVVTSRDATDPGVNAAKRKVREFVNTDATAKLDADDSKVVKGVDSANRKVRQFADADATAELDIDETKALQAIDRARDALRRFTSSRDNKGELDVDTSKGESSIRRLGGAISSFKSEHGKGMSFAVETGAGIARIAALGTAISQLIPIAVAAAGAVAGIGAVGVVGIGTIAAGFNGIGDAMTAMGEKATGGGGAVKASAAEIKAAAQSVKDAEYDLEQAHKDEQRAQEDLTRAQADLTIAREDAIRTLRDLKLETGDMALRERDANLSVREAEAALEEVRKRKGVTALDIERAELRIDEARQRQKRTTVEASDFERKRQEIEAKGVEGSDQVVAANDRIQQANERVQAAHHNVEQAIIRVAQAQEALIEAQKPKGGGGGGVDKLAEAMAKLGPRAQEFAKFMHNFVETDLKKLSQAGQEAFLPGIQRGLTELKPIMASLRGPFAEFSRTFGQAIGDMIPIIASMAPAFTRFATASLQGLAPLSDVLMHFSAQLGGVLDQMVASGTAKAAMTQLVNVVGEVLSILPPLIQFGQEMFVALGPSLTQLFHALAQALVNLLPAISANLPATAQFISFASQLIGPLAMLAAVVTRINPLVMVMAKVMEIAGTWLGKMMEKFGIQEKFEETAAAMDQFNQFMMTGEMSATQLSTGLDKATNSTQNLADAQAGLADSTLSLRQAENQYYESIERTTASIRENGRTTDVHTTKGRANREALDAQAQAARRLLQSIQDNEGESPKFVQTQAEARAALVRSAQQMGMSQAAARRYADEILKIPAAKTTTIKADVAQALSAVNSVRTAIANVNGKTVTITTRREEVLVSAGGNTVRARSKGGIIPGTPSSVDTEPTMLAQGEFVVNSAQTQRWRPMLEAINSGTPISMQAARSAGAPVESAGAGTGGGGMPVLLEFRSSGSAVDDFLVEIMRRAVRVRGGNVQDALGPAGRN